MYPPQSASKSPPLSTALKPKISTTVSERFACCFLYYDGAPSYAPQLRRLVHAAASDPIQAEPSEEQKERVRGFQRTEKAKRRLDKNKRSDIKKSRSSKNWD